jgi:hypothetical protein
VVLVELCRPQALQALYNLRYDRFTNHHGPDNLIWAWTSDKRNTGKQNTGG